VAARSQPCWTALIAFDAPLPCKADIIRDAAPVAWAARNSAKPGRAGGETWVVQADAAWSARHLEEDAQKWQTIWQPGWPGRLPLPLPRQTYLAAHRWRYARPDPPRAPCGTPICGWAPAATGCWAPAWNWRGNRARHWPPGSAAAPGAHAHGRRR
jgi:predicted NAD/FAD-dependent oxidoreductase